MDAMRAFIKKPLSDLVVVFYKRAVTPPIKNSGQVGLAGGNIGGYSYSKMTVRSLFL